MQRLERKLEQQKLTCYSNCGLADRFVVLGGMARSRSPPGLCLAKLPMLKSSVPLLRGPYLVRGKRGVTPSIASFELKTQLVTCDTDYYFLNRR